MIRRVALTVMALVTAWSMWAWAQQPVKAQLQPGALGQKSAAVVRPETKHAPEPAEEEEPAPLNWTEFDEHAAPPFLAMLVNFGVLAAGYFLLAKKPIVAGLQARRDAIAKEIADAQRMKTEAEERAKVYQAKLETLEAEVRTAREALLRTGEAERDRIVQEAEAKADRLRRDAEFLVAQELKQMRQDIWREAVESAVSAAEEILKKRVTPADQERLAEAFLADLGDKPKAGPPSIKPPEGVS